MKKLYMKLFLLISITHQIVGTQSGTFETLEEFLEDQVANFYFPQAQSIGLGLTVASGIEGMTTYSNGFGHRDLEADSLATSKSLFCIGSISKSFTSSLIVKVLSEKFPVYGEYVLEIPIKDLASFLNVTLSDRYRSESISFRDLLSHRSCLNSHLIGMAMGAVNDTQDYLYRTRYESETCPFRAGYHYNNAMYTLAGDLIGKIAGDSYENLMRNFLDDLGMRDSRLVNLEDDYNNLENMMQGYYNANGVIVKGNGQQLSRVSIVAPAGAILSTAEEMVHYINFHLNKGKNSAGQQIISEDAMKWISTPAVSLGNSKAYGLGFDLEFIPGGESLMTHGGHWPPYLSFLSINPNLNIGVFTSSNGPGSSVPSYYQTEMHSNIYQFIYQNQNFSNKNFKPVFEMTREIFGSHQLEPVKDVKKNQVQAVCASADVIGQFGSAVNGEFEIFETPEGILKIRYGNWGDGNLHQLDDEECKFDIEWLTDIVIMFYLESDGNILPSTFELQKSEVTGTWDMGLLTLVVEVASIERNLMVGNLPQIPYDPNSCAPSL